MEEQTTFYRQADGRAIGWLSSRPFGSQAIRRLVDCLPQQSHDQTSWSHLRNWTTHLQAKQPPRNYLVGKIWAFGCPLQLPANRRLKFGRRSYESTSWQNIPWAWNLDDVDLLHRPGFDRTSFVKFPKMSELITVCASSRNHCMGSSNHKANDCEGFKEGFISSEADSSLYIT